VWKDSRSPSTTAGPNRSNPLIRLTSRALASPWITVPSARNQSTVTRASRIPRIATDARYTSNTLPSADRTSTYHFSSVNGQPSGSGGRSLSASGLDVCGRASITRAFRDEMSRSSPACFRKVTLAVLFQIPILLVSQWVDGASLATAHLVRKPVACPVRAGLPVNCAPESHLWVYQSDVNGWVEGGYVTVNAGLLWGISSLLAGSASLLAQQRNTVEYCYPAWLNRSFY